MNSISLSGRNALVTGGARGIGASITDCLLAAGASVTVVGRSESNFINFCERFGHKDNTKFIPCDLSNVAEVERLSDKLSKDTFDILINNAGTNKISAVHEVEMSDWDRIQCINTRVPMLLSKAVLPNMLKKKWGRIVNISSIFGSITKEKRVSYTTSKAALIGMTKSAAVDYAGSNILINSVSPGFIDTELTRTILKPNEIEMLIETVPMKRLGQPHEIANVVLFLVSDLNTFLTGQNIILDGGYSIV